MPFQGEASERLAVDGVENTDGPMTVSHINESSFGIVTDIIGIVAHRDGLDPLKGRSIKNIQGPAFSIGYENMVKFRNKKDSLGFMKIWNAVDPLSRLKIDNLQRIIAEGCDKKTLIFKIDG